MKKIRRSWFRNQSTLINMVQQYPIIYDKNTTLSKNEYKIALKLAWEEASYRCCMPERSCKRIWTDIKSRYAKLKMSIRTGRVTEEIVRNNLHTGKYLDGCLSFLDPYICDADISRAINIKINKLLRIVDPSQDHSEYIVPDQQIALINTLVDNTQEHLINASGNTVKHSLENLKPNTNILTTTETNIPTNNLTTGITYDSINLGLESELLIEDGIKLEDDEDEVMEDNLINNNMNDIVDEHILPDIDTNINMTMVENTEGNTLTVFMDPMDIAKSTENNESVISSNVVTGVSDNDMKKFFSELGKVMNVEMSLEKQKISRFRINALVQEILDDESL